MKRDHFEQSLAQVRAQPLPDCPPDLPDRVLRRIRQSPRSSRAEGSVSAWGWLQPTLNPGALAVILGITFAVSATTTVMASRWDTVSEKQSQAGLGFDVLSSPHVLECHHTHPGAIPRIRHHH